MEFSSKELKRISRENLLGNYQIAMRAFIWVMLVTLMIDLPFSTLLQSEHPTTTQNILYLAVEFLISIISGVLQVGIMQIHLTLARGNKIAPHQVFHCFRSQTDRYIICVFIKLIATLVCLSPVFLAYFLADVHNMSEILLWGLGIVIGVILAIYINLTIYCMSYLLLDQENLSVIDSLKESRRLMRGFKHKLFVCYLSFIGMDLLEVLSFGIGALWVEPYKSQTFANFYLAVYNQERGKGSTIDEYV